MDHMQILRRAFNITLNYRTLWIFGILLAISSGGSGGSAGGSGSGGGGSSGGGGFPGGTVVLPPFLEQNLLAIGVALACFILLLVVVFSILRYVSETALIRMVDGHEATGERLSFRQGWRLGWSRAAWRMFLIDLLVGLIIVPAIVLLLAIAFSPLLLLTTQNDTFRILGVVLAIGLGLLVIFLAIVVGTVVSVVAEFWRRAVALENLGVFDAIRRGFTLVRRRLGDVVIMALILFGLGLAFSLLLIPVVFLLLFAAGLLGGIPGVAAGLITSLFVEASRNPLPVIIGFAVGLPIFILVMSIPLAIIGGIAETYRSTVWTLAFRETSALDTPPEPPADIPPEPAEAVGV